MKKIHKGLIATLASIAFLVIPAVPANAGELHLWEGANYAGHGITSPSCDTDFDDNKSNSGTQNLVGWVSIWNNTIFNGDERIARLGKNKKVPVFAKHNAADHATCYGGK